MASLLIFLVTNTLPGSIANVVLGTQASPGEVAAFEERHGLSRPLLLRYFEWLKGVVVGDFGTTFVGGRDVLGEILPRLGISVWLVVLGMLFALVIAIPLGSFAALKRRHVSGFIASTFSQAGLSVPAFWAGMWLVIVFAVNLRWLPAGGYVPLSRDPVGWATHLVLPVASLALVQGSLLARYVRSAVIEVTSEDWLLVGAIIIEQVFAIQGLGSRLLLAVSQRDLVLVQGIVLILVWAVLVINFVVDVVYQAVDPRLKEAGTIS